MTFEDYVIESDDLTFRITRAEERLSKLISSNQNGDHNNAIKSLRERIAELKMERSRG